MAKKLKKKVDLKKIADGVRLMLEGMGEDPERDGLQKTPERVADFLCRTYGRNVGRPKRAHTTAPGRFA